jgi:hypothetical protein
LASDLKTYGEDHPKVAIDRMNIGLAWHSLGDYKKAIVYYKLALVCFEKKLGPDHHYTKSVRKKILAVNELKWSVHNSVSPFKIPTLPPK